MSRTIVRVRGKAREALSGLCKTFNLKPSELVEKLLVQHFYAILDDALCKKRHFKSSIVYELELPFCFPYECEEFEFQAEDTKARLYIERVPKRRVTDRLPFKTLATSIFQLTSEEERFAKETKVYIARDNLNSKYSILAYNSLKSLITIYRKVTEDFYNIGVIQPPLNHEEFQKKVKMSIILNQKEYTTTRFMPIKEDSFISVAQTLDKQLHSKIVTAVARKLSNKEHDHFLTQPNEYLDAAIVFYYQEQWNLCLLDSVIAMESGMANLVFKSDATKLYLRKISELPTKLKKVYREASGLPKKIEKFLFPIIGVLSLSKVQSNLRGMMPFIRNKKSEDGVYDLRSKIVHEGILVGKKEAEGALKIASQFFEILKSVNNTCMHNP